jgi:hypothetical protein
MNETTTAISNDLTTDNNSTVDTATTKPTGGLMSIVSSGLPNNMLPNIRNHSYHRGGTGPHRGTTTQTTDENSSDGAFSRVSSDNGQLYEVIEYDYHEDANLLGSVLVEPSEIFADVVGKTAVISIDADSPAAEALRANAKIHVSSVGKAARAVQLQSVRRALKRATGITKSGNKKGKPPRIPPTLLNNNNNNTIIVTAGPVDVDEYMDDGGGETTDTSNNNYINNTSNQQQQQHQLKEVLHEGIEEDEDLDNHDNGEGFHSDQQLDDYSNSEGGYGEMDDSRNSHASKNIKASYPKGSIQQQQQQQQEKLVDRETMHIPDGVAPGTVEAGKKGMSTLIDDLIFILFCVG